MGAFGGRARRAVVVAYAAQAFGYATVMTTLPAFRDRYGFSETAVSGVVLGVCVAAALGSLASGRIASSRGSRLALAAGLTVQTVGLASLALPLPTSAFVGAEMLYGMGLGAVDATSAMQGILAEQRLRRPLMSSFFAAYTAAAIVAALCVSAMASVGGQTAAVLVAALVTAGSAIVGARMLFPGLSIDRSGRGPSATAAEETSDTPSEGARGEQPEAIGRIIRIFGMSILVVFVADSAVSTWSTDYLQHTLMSGAVMAPLAYAAYQAVVLVTRTAGDRLQAGRGSVGLVRGATAVSVGGFVLVALLPTTVGAIVGFALAGVAVGLLVPMTFSAAGRAAGAHSEGVISQMNTFNYVGAVIGGAVIGPLGQTGIGMHTAFLLPGLCLVVMMPLARYYARRSPISNDRARPQALALDASRQSSEAEVPLDPSAGAAVSSSL